MLETNPDSLGRGGELDKLFQFANHLAVNLEGAEGYDSLVAQEGRPAIAKSLNLTVDGVAEGPFRGELRAQPEGTEWIPKAGEVPAARGACEHQLGATGGQFRWVHVRCFGGGWERELPSISDAA